MAIEVMDTDLEYVVGILEVSNRLSLAKIHNHPLKRHYYELAKEVFGRLSMPSELASDPLATRLIFSTVMQARELETRYFSDNSVEEPQQGANLIKAYCELLQYYQAITYCKEYENCFAARAFEISQSRFSFSAVGSH